MLEHGLLVGVDVVRYGEGHVLTEDESTKEEPQQRTIELPLSCVGGNPGLLDGEAAGLRREVDPVDMLAGPTR